MLIGPLLHVQNLQLGNSSQFERNQENIEISMNSHYLFSFGAEKNVSVIVLKSYFFV